jgi:hypothetical protein
MAATLCLAGCASHRASRQPPAPVTIQVTGHPGTTFTGTIETGRTSERVSGIAPTVLELAGRPITCSFKQGAEAGWLRFEVLENGQTLGVAGTVGAYSRCRFKIRSGRISTLKNWRYLGEMTN